MAFALPDDARASKTSPPPLGRALAPDVDLALLERRRPAPGAAADGAEPLRHPRRGNIGGIDAMDDFAPAERVKRPVGRRRGALGRIAFAPGGADEAPADLRARPPFRLP